MVSIRVTSNRIQYSVHNTLSAHGSDKPTPLPTTGCPIMRAQIRFDLASNNDATIHQINGFVYFHKVRNKIVFLSLATITNNN